jgi:hypothetical protein
MNLGTRCKEVPLCTNVVICYFLLMTITACAGNNTIILTPSFMPTLPTDTPYATIPMINTPTPACLDRLAFLSDVTIPDYTTVIPATILDKQWLVQNSGSCNWDDRYRLRLVGGDALGTSPEQALYPARAGKQATLRIIFTAPLDAGSYTSEWQAFDANGISFGDSFFIKIIVQP